MDNTRRPKAYDRGQHQLICEYLGVSDDPDAPGDTAFEAVVRLKESKDLPSCSQCGKPNASKDPFSVQDGRIYCRSCLKSLMTLKGREVRQVKGSARKDEYIEHLETELRELKEGLSVLFSDGMTGLLRQGGKTRLGVSRDWSAYQTVTTGD